jgi:hypothetical protein
VKDDFGRLPFTIDWVDLYGLSLEEDVSVKLKGLFKVDGWKMPN